MKLVTFPLLSVEVMEKFFYTFPFPHVFVAYIASILPLLREVHE